MPLDVNEIDDAVAAEGAFVGRLMAAMQQVIVGQDQMVRRLMIGLLANGHMLLEGAPGLAKTLAVTSLAKALNAGYQRVQFTPDLLPADLIGTLIYRPQTGDFQVRKGPIFANLILADEINRAPAKVQSALLEAMQENQVTIGDESFALPQPFLVLATQNPIEQDGTYPLPEAQMDRFMLKLRVEYPSRDEEIQILDRMARTKADLSIEPVASTDDILRARGLIDRIHLDDAIKHYIVDLVYATRDATPHGLDLGDYVDYGASPRATIFITLAAKAHAFMAGRGYVLPEDVKAVAPDVLRHRILVSYRAEAEGMTPDDIATRILDAVSVP